MKLSAEELRLLKQLAEPGDEYGNHYLIDHAGLVLDMLVVRGLVAVRGTLLKLTPTGARACEDDD